MTVFLLIMNKKDRRCVDDNQKGNCHYSNYNPALVWIDKIPTQFPRVYSDEKPVLLIACNYKEKSRTHRDTYLTWSA